MRYWWSAMLSDGFTHRPNRPWSSPLGPGFTPFFAELCNPISRQAIELESYPNYPRIQQVF